MTMTQLVQYGVYAALLLGGYLIRHWQGSGAPAPVAPPAVDPAHPLLSGLSGAVQQFEKALIEAMINMAKNNVQMPGMPTPPPAPPAKA